MVIFKNCAPIDCISEKNYAQLDTVKGLDIVMPMYSLKEYSEIIIQKQNEVYGSITKMIQMITANSEFFSFKVKII